MIEARDLLIELGTEELPPKALPGLSDAFTAAIAGGLDDAELSHGELTGFATPRRLAVLIHALAEAQPDRSTERRGPALSAAFDDNGHATRAAEGFARSCGVAVNELERLETAQGGWLIYRADQTGRRTEELLPDIVRQALDKLPIPKRMRWSTLAAEFVRPVHWLVLLFGKDVIETEILGVHAGRNTYGHRFHHPAPLSLTVPADYAPLLATEGYAIAAFAERRDAIRAQVTAAAAKAGGSAVIDDALLDEVTGMVEWPVALLGKFEPRFLDVPAEALISAMKSHQKYFHVIDGQDKLLPYFITVSNIESREPQVVRAGNERVIRPRLADAAFFWQQDCKRGLGARLGSLKAVVFQHKLGSLYDKAQRIGSLAGDIAGRLGADAYRAERAATLCKCDLLSDMVAEFPELQGTMGRYYAMHDGEPEEVAHAIEEHYLPRFAGDRLPQTEIGRAVAIADKLDTLVGIFGIGQPPSGDKDPFALRRAALGLVRILIEQNLNLNLDELLERAAYFYNQQQHELIAGPVASQVFEFISGRLSSYYVAQGFAPDVIDAVACLQPTYLNDMDRRLRALAAFRKLPEAESLAAANKRIANILRKADDKTVPEFNHALLIEDAERRLAEHLQSLDSRIMPLFDARAYEEAMYLLAQLRETVDGFFDTVMVMVDDDELRGNRLALLNDLRNRFLHVADLSRLQSSVS